MEDKPVLVVGDVHGNLHRLTALLEKASTGPPSAPTEDFLVVQLGDLGHHGGHTKWQDREIFERVYKNGLVDVLLWGNHDRAIIDRKHLFGGYDSPFPETVHIINTMQYDGRLRLAYSAHGWLITHAGLHAQFGWLPLKVDVDREDPQAIADWLNSYDAGRSSNVAPWINNVSGRRGGMQSFGGILWRDVSEKLYTKVPQVFGHSASSQHVVRGERDQWYCVDIGGRPTASPSDADCLAGIWLPSQEIVQVDQREVWGDSPSTTG